MWIKSAYIFNITTALCKGSVFDCVSSTGSLDSRLSCHWKEIVVSDCLKGRKHFLKCQL